MPAGSKSHRDKKNPTAAEVHKKRKTKINAADKVHKWFQIEWRKHCLLGHAKDGKLTPKNLIEAEHLGITIAP